MTIAVITGRLIDGTGRDPVANAVVVWDHAHVVEGVVVRDTRSHAMAASGTQRS